MNTRFRDIRRAQGLSMIGLSVRARVSTATLTAIEKWGHVPSIDVRQRLAKALGLGEEYLWPDEIEQEVCNG